MFSYYGSKSKITHWYPAPKYSTIIEPFAGAAWYSVKQSAGRSVILADVDPTIQCVWDWIINRADADEVAQWPLFVPKTRMMRMADPGADIFYRFWGNRGSEHPRNVSGGFDGVTRLRWALHAARIPLAKHWTFIPRSYNTLKNIEATWFIDPPYSGQHLYRYNTIDYQDLAAWCQSRNGQVIVCESLGATWLPFRQLRAAPTQRQGSKHRVECVWENQ